LNFYIKNVKIIVKISNIDLIKGFDFDLENNSIFIGNPSSEEIQITYLRKYLSETKLDNQKAISKFGRNFIKNRIWKIFIKFIKIKKRGTGCKN